MMIKKLPINNYSTPIEEKINELVDTVNNIVSVQEKLIDSRFLVETKHEAPADPYAKQRRWIGKLCRFWDFDYEQDYFDTLKGITDDGLFIGHNGSWKHCEPVKPDNDVIFKEE